METYDDTYMNTIHKLLYTQRACASLILRELTCKASLVLPVGVGSAGYRRSSVTECISDTVTSSTVLTSGIFCHGGRSMSTKMFLFTTEQ